MKILHEIQPLPTIILVCNFSVLNAVKVVHKSTVFMTTQVFTMLMDLFILDYIYRSGNQTSLPHFDTIHQIYIIKMKFLILFGILAMTLAASAQEDVSPPPVIEREEDMIEPPRLTEEVKQNYQQIYKFAVIITMKCPDMVINEPYYISDGTEIIYEF